MDIRLDYYKAFYQVAQCGSFSAAARQLFMTQSAVSQAVKHLESALQVSLFVRGSRGTTLTAEGEVLFAYVAQSLSLIRKGEDELQRIKKIEQGELRIGVGDTISRYLLLPYLDCFHQQHPGIRLRIFNRTSGDTVEMLKAGRIDLAFINLPYLDEALDVCKYLEVHDTFVAGNKFASLKNCRLLPQDVGQLPLILLERDSNSRRYVDDWFLSHGVQLRPEIELGSHDLLLEFAKINLGVSCVTREFAKKELDNGELFELDLLHPIPVRSVGICTLRSVTVPLAARAFLDVMGQDTCANPHTKEQTT